MGTVLDRHRQLTCKGHQGGGPTLLGSCGKFCADGSVPPTANVEFAGLCHTCEGLDQGGALARAGARSRQGLPVLAQQRTLIADERGLPQIGAICDLLEHEIGDIGARNAYACVDTSPTDAIRACARPLGEHWTTHNNPINIAVL